MSELKECPKSECGTREDGSVWMSVYRPIPANGKCLGGWIHEQMDVHFSIGFARFITHQLNTRVESPLIGELEKLADEWTSGPDINSGIKFVCATQLRDIIERNKAIS